MLRFYYITIGDKTYTLSSAFLTDKKIKKFMKKLLTKYKRYAILYT